MGGEDRGNEFCAVHPHWVKSLEQMNKNIAIFLNYKTLDEERQQNLHENQKEIKTDVKAISQSMEELKLIMVGSYVTKEEFQTHQKEESQKIIKLHERIDKHLKKSDNKEDDKKYLNNKIFYDVIKLLITAILLLAGIKVILPAIGG